MSCSNLPAKREPVKKAHNPALYLTASRRSPVVTDPAEGTGCAGVNAAQSRCWREILRVFPLTHSEASQPGDAAAASGGARYRHTCTPLPDNTDSPSATAFLIIKTKKESLI